jgi:MFS family permease
MTLTLLGDVFLGTFLTLIADRVGRRNVLLGGSAMMIMSGFIFSYFENFWILLIAAILGVISVTGGDFGPFRSIEEYVIKNTILMFVLLTKIIDQCYHNSRQEKRDLMFWHGTSRLQRFNRALGARLRDGSFII